MDERVLPRDIQGPIKLICHHCGAENPAKAYCCITCFKVLRPKANIPAWRLAMRPSVSLVLFFALIMLGGLYAMKRWIDAVEARVRMDLKTADYNISVVADKRRKGLIGHEKRNALPDMDAVENGQTSASEADAKGDAAASEAAPASAPAADTKNP